MTPVTLALEHVGENYDKGRVHHERRFRRGALRADEYKKLFGGSRRPWVAEIVGPDPKYGLERRFLTPNTGYREANRDGSRGIKKYFHLFPGHVYEVCHWVGWERKERYFCRIEGGKIVRLTEDQVKSCLNADSA